MSQAKYKRVLIKVSGEALSGDKGTGFDHDYIDKVVNQIIKARQLGVQIGIVVDIQNPLVDPVNKLGLIGIVNRHFGPDRLAVLIQELTGVDPLKELSNGSALNDLLQTGGQHIMLHLHPGLLGIAVDPGKPPFHTGMILNILSTGHQGLPCQRIACLPCLFHHTVHIGKNAVHCLLGSDHTGVGPKLIGLHPDTGNKGVLLHIPCAKGFIKVIHNGYDGLFHTLLLSGQIYMYSLPLLRISCQGKLLFQKKGSILITIT